MITFFGEVNNFAAIPVITVAMTPANIDFVESPNTNIPKKAAIETTT